MNEASAYVVNRCTGQQCQGITPTVSHGRANASRGTPALIKFFYSPADAQVNCIKINIQTAPTCFGAVTPSLGRALFVLAKVTVVKIAN
jgi:hypothetical protein